MQNLPFDVLQALLPVMQHLGEQQRIAVRKAELPRIDRIGVTAARAVGGGGFAYGHRAIMEAVGYASSVDPDDDWCRDCGYESCRCDFHCANCDVEECGLSDCGCSCGNCEYDPEDDDD